MSLFFQGILSQNTKNVLYYHKQRFPNLHCYSYEGTSMSKYANSA